MANIPARLRGFKEAMDVANARSREVDRMRLDRRARREALDRIAEDLYAAQDRVKAQYPLDDELTPNASKLEWIKGPGVDRDGHSLAWWKAKAAKWSKSIHDRPKVSIRVVTWDRAGQRDRARSGEFEPDDLKSAKEFAREAVESGGTAQVEGRVEIPYQSGVTIEIGEWKNAASNGWYVWTVDGESFVPVSRRGPFEQQDEALGVAKQTIRGGSVYDAVISLGGDPDASDFEIWKSFKAGSGEVHYASDLPRVGGRLREYR